MNSKILEELDKKVQESLENDEIPIGAVIFDKKGNYLFYISFIYTEGRERHG